VEDLADLSAELLLGFITLENAMRIITLAIWHNLRQTRERAMAFVIDNSSKFVGRFAKILEGVFIVRLL
jgi:hypothetical protein